MDSYYIAHEPNLRFYPNYSFSLGSLRGDGVMQIAAVNQNGNRLRVVGIDDSLLFERKLDNNGNWGTLPVCCVDLDGDGRDEVLVPTSGRHGQAIILGLNGAGQEVIRREVSPSARDDYGIRVPLLAGFRYSTSAPTGAVAALAGGSVVALDGALRELWRVDGLRHDFGHEFFVEDFDGDGMDEIWFCTIDHIAISYEPGGANLGELVVIDHDGKVVLRSRVDEYYPDSHFDDIRIADFMGTGTSQVLVEKGILLGLDGRVIWDLSRHLEHGQWIAHAPGGNHERVIMISELWSAEASAAIIRGRGERVSRVVFPAAARAQGNRLEWRVLATRCNAVAWNGAGGWEFFVAEQALTPTTHDCFKTIETDLRCYFFGLDGELRSVLPFTDAQVEGQWYNGEVHSMVADVDGDGRPEVVFPKQDGRVLIIKKR